MSYLSKKIFHPQNTALFVTITSFCGCFFVDKNSHNLTRQLSEIVKQLSTEIKLKKNSSNCDGIELSTSTKVRYWFSKLEGGFCRSDSIRSVLLCSQCTLVNFDKKPSGNYKLFLTNIIWWNVLFFRTIKSTNRWIIWLVKSYHKKNPHSTSKWMVP